MIKISYTTRMPVGADELWRALTDFAASPRWQPAVIEERCEPAGPPEVGSRIFQARRFMGRRVEGWNEVDAVRPPMYLHSRGDGVVTEYRLVPAGAGTELTFTIELAAIPWLARPVVRLVLRRDVSARFRRLRALLAAGGWAQVQC